MSFGFTNASAFQQEMNDMFQDQLRQFICKELCAKARK
mgnify:CR=1 FL=1